MRFRTPLTVSAVFLTLGLAATSSACAAPATASTTAAGVLDGPQRARQSVTITLLGDSTGNESTEWFYRLSVWLAATWPTYRTEYRLFNATTQAYGPIHVLRPGNGGPVLRIFNGSVPSKTAAYALDATRFGKLTGHGGDLFLLSYGHNETGSTYPSFATLANRLASTYQAGIMPVLQNPEGAPSKTPAQVNAYKARQAVVRRLATGKRWPLIDAATPIAADKRGLKALVPDGVHPNAAGQAMWLAAAKKPFIPAPRSVSRAALLTGNRS
ncbi:SGNH/GDSL hydrolase family protein [Actinoplanes sp. URMC 104]|uniref:SGNH/GDSL hydrolase family protein n=1 Tax=Actinoplanes sp. URMC 104 TaxID=3423409 RepID=UPI003F1DFDE8